MAKLLINPDTLYDGSGSGLSQAVVDPISGLVFVSGQVDWDGDFQVSSDTVAGQLKGALAKLKTVLEAANAGIDTLLQVRLYIRGELEDHMEAVIPIFAEFVGDSRPAVTGVGVSSLASKETLVEVEAIARVRD